MPLHRLDDLRVGGVFIDVVQLFGVLGQVVKLPSGRGLFTAVVVAAIVENQLVRLGPDAKVSGVVVMRQVHPVAVVRGLFPALGFLAGLADGFEALTLHLLRRLDAREGEHRRREVDVLDDRVGNRAGLDRLG